MTNKYLVTAKRKRGLNWSTQVEAHSFANAVDNGLKSHYDAGFRQEEETIELRVKNGLGEEIIFDVAISRNGWTIRKSALAPVPVPVEKIKKTRKSITSARKGA